MNTDQLPAGKELDALVAQAMGWSDVTLDNGCRGIPPKTTTAMGPYKTRSVPEWSTDFLSALQVWEKLPRQSCNGLELSVNLVDCAPLHEPTERSYAVYAEWHGERQYSGSAHTPELAICRAMLDAKEKRIENRYYLAASQPYHPQYLTSAEYERRLVRAVKAIQAIGNHFFMCDFDTWRSRRGIDLLTAWTWCADAARAGEAWPWEK